MAPVRLKCVYYYFLILCALLVYTKANNGFVQYELNEPSLAIKEEDVILLDRDKRYVETAIPRLADNYFRQDSYPSKNLDKDDLDTFSRRRGRMEMIGNLAISAEELAVSHNHGGGGDSKKEEPAVTTEKVIAAEKSTKKATGLTNKKNYEPQEGKSIIDHHQTGPAHNITEHSGDTNISLQSKVNVTPTSVPPPQQHTSSSQHEENEHQDNSSTTVLHEVSNHHDKGVHEGTSNSDYSGVSEGITTTDNFSDDEFPKDITNNTLLKNNITDKQEDHHSYYISKFIVDDKIAKQYWVEMDNKKDVVVNKMLSTSHRRAATVWLNFNFPFYGHLIQKVTIATGGFLYTGDYIHSWLAATQYIAPLMANFDSGLSDESQVRYTDNGTSFTVEWDRVRLQDKPEAGQFTFQVTLHKNGDIVFIYKDVPILVETIEDCQHPVKVGLSDAYIIDRTVFFVRRKTIYEYHRVNFKKEDIKNWTVVYMSALPTCRNFTDCASCISKDTLFDCKWCPAVNRCSSGYDRHRQEWQLQQCELTAVNTTVGCQLGNGSIVSERQHQQGHLMEAKNHQYNPHAAINSQAAIDHENKGHFGHSGLIGLLFFILSISGLGLWLLYAYRNPHTTSGQVLIKYRPSQWTLRRGEARYTAATIHM